MLDVTCNLSPQTSYTPNMQCLAACRVDGLKRVSRACVGEKHSLALHSWCHSPKQLRLPILAAAAALPADDTPHPHLVADTQELSELAAQAQEDADWTAAADRSIGGAVTVTSPEGSGAASLGCSDGGVGNSDWGQGAGARVEWLGREFWLGLEGAHRKIQTAHAQAE